MNFFESLNNKLINLMDNLDTITFQKITNGFYQFINANSNNSIILGRSSLLEESIKDKILDFLIHTPSIKKYSKVSKPSEDVVLFLIHMGKIYHELIMLDKSLEFYQEALYLREQSLGIKHLFTAELQEKIGKLYEEGGAYSEALRYYKKALWIRQELSYVENNLLLAESYNNLAVLYYYMKEFTMAKNYIDKTVDIREKLLSSDHELLMNSYYNQKFIYKEYQPKKDSISHYLNSVHENITAFFRRFVHLV